MFWVQNVQRAGPHAHDISRRVWLGIIIVLQNLITTNHRKSGKSKFGRKMAEPDVVTMNPVPCKRGLCLRIMHTIFAFSKCSYRKRIVSVSYEIPACIITFI